MIPTSSGHPYIPSIEHLGRRFDVTCRIGFDGIEYVGRLWFAEDGTGENGLPDRASIPGRTREEVLERARGLAPRDLLLRYRRAVAEKRRFLRLRRETNEILAKIRYLNQIAIAVRDGLLDEEGASQEIELTEQQLHDCIALLRHNAGLEE